MTGKKTKNSITPRTKAEWVSMIISIVLVAGVVGVVIALWLSPSKTPARFRIDRRAIRTEAGHYYLPITVTNEGDTTGAQVTVEGRLKVAGNEQTSATTFDFVPAHSNVEGVLIFDSEPTSAELRVVSYQQP
jgi:uncharacterized protein (TIGR02588 family)